MSSYLGDFGFEYDVFLSYGWAANPNADEGDRLWVQRFHKCFQGEMRERLEGAAKVYFDQYDGRTGYVFGNVEHAIEHSAIVLFLVHRVRAAQVPGAIENYRPFGIQCCQSGNLRVTSGLSVWLSGRSTVENSPIL
jgi:hypothetical protein